MKLLCIVVNAPERLEETLEGLIEAGVTGATVVDSVGMGHILEAVPLFAGIRSMFRTARPRNNMVFSVVKDEQVEESLGVVEKVLGGQGAGCAFVIPVERAVGLH
jgi:nitrogen regulatory protein P-II 1